jgi:hypothetical protein
MRSLPSEGDLKRHIFTIAMSFLASVISGGVFVIALIHQFALVEVAASLLTGLQVFFLSASIGDLLDDKKEPNRPRNAAVILATVVLVGFYLSKRFIG